MFCMCPQCVSLAAASPMHAEEELAKLRAEERRHLINAAALKVLGLLADNRPETRAAVLQEALRINQA